MPILNHIDYQTRKGRIAISVVYALLSLGGICMVYPFLLMLTMSFSNEVDVHNRAPIPRYLWSEEMLYRKLLATRYLSFQKHLDVRHLNRNYLSDYYRFEELGDLSRPILTVETDPETGQSRRVPLDPDRPGQRRRVEDWAAFSKTLPESHLIPGSLPWLRPLYQEWLRERYQTTEAMAAAYGEARQTFVQVEIPFYNPYIRSWALEEGRKVEEWREFWGSQSPLFKLPIRMDGEYQRYLSQTFGGLSRLNELSEQDRAALADYRLGSKMPENAVEARWWRAYLQSRLPYVFLDEASITPLYQQWLKEEYKGNVAALNARYETRFESFEAIPFTTVRPKQTRYAAEWSLFLQQALPYEQVRLRTVEALWDRWLQAAYGGDVKALAAAHQLPLDRIEKVYVPIPESDRLMVRQHRWTMTWDYLWGNYARVIDHLLLSGRAFLNTGILCAAMVLSQLTINPLCAYALSRFALGYKYKVILFLIATMAFPAEVMMIPNFLNLKEFGLLNTYWALILPTLVSGYYIFVMKGFFDSIGKELFEAAQIDGAGELRMFIHIAAPLSKPIFAVKALNAFMIAYGGFVWAFLVCQDRELWTVMVQLYAFQQTQPQAVVMTTLVIASIPTLIVYLACQKIIMRGIILPTLK